MAEFHENEDGSWTVIMESEEYEWLVAKLKEDEAVNFCKFCAENITFDGIAWVDVTEGDCCSGDDDGNNENQLHVPFHKVS